MGVSLRDIIDEAVEGPQKPDRREEPRKVAKIPTLGARPKPGPRRGIADRIREVGEWSEGVRQDMTRSLRGEWSAVPQLMEFKDIRRPGERPPTPEEIATARAEQQRTELNRPLTDPFGMPVYNTPGMQKRIDVIAPGSREQRIREKTPYAEVAEPQQKSTGTRSYREAKASGETIQAARRIAEDPSQPEEKRKYAADVAHNLARRQEAEIGKGGAIDRAVSRFTFGLMRNTSDIYKDIRSAAETNDLVTEEDLRAIGATTESGETMRTEPTFKESLVEETVPAMVADVATYAILGPSRTLARAAAAAEAKGARGLAQAIRFSLENAAPTSESWRARALLRAGRGAIQGAGIGAVHDAADVVRQGGTLEEAAATASVGFALGAGMGAGLEAGAGALWDAIGPTTKRWVAAAARRIPPTQAHLNDLAANIVREREAVEATARVNAERAREGKLPIDDKNPEAHLKSIATALEEILQQKEAARAARPGDVAAALESPDRPPIYEPAGREWWRENAPLENADVAGPVRLAEQADMSKNLENVETDMEAAEIQQRLEQSAAPKQGPLTLAQTLRNPNARAAIVAAAGGQFNEDDDDDVTMAFLAATTSPQVRKAIIEETERAVEKGLEAPSLRKLAAKHGVSVETARTILRSAGIDTRKSIPRDVSLAPEGEGRAATPQERWRRTTINSGRAGLEGAAPQVDRILARVRAVAARNGIEISDDAWVRVEREMKNKGPAAGMALLASQTEDEDERNALLGAAALTTGRLKTLEEANYYSRLRQAVEKMPKAWEGPRAAADWLSKLSSDQSFSKAEFDHVLRPALEQARDAKKKLSKAEVLDLFERNKIVLERNRYGRPANTLAEGGGEAMIVKGKDPNDTPQQSSPAWEPGDRTRVEDVEQDREDRLAEVERLENADAEYASAIRRLGEHENINAGNNDRFHRALEDLIEQHDAGDGDGDFDTWDVAHGLVNEGWVDQPSGVELDLSHMPSNRRLKLAEMEDGNMGWKVQRAGAGDWVDAFNGQVFPSKLHAMHHIANNEGWESEWGDLANVLDEVEVEADEDGYHLVKERYDWNTGTYIKRRIDGYENYSDADDLVEAYVNDHVTPEDPPEVDLNDIHSLVQDVRQARMDSYRAVEAREEFEGEDWDERLAEAEQQDRENRKEYFTKHAKLKDYDEEYYDLTPTEQQFHDRGRELGAVGYTNLSGNENEGQYVFDPDLPHTPLLRKGEPQDWADDANQLSFDDVDGFVPVTYRALKLTGSPTYSGTQRTGGGEAYREILIQHKNWPGSGLGSRGHWYGTLKDVIGHIRGDVQKWVPGTLNETDEVRAAADVLRVLGDRWQAANQKAQKVLDEVPPYFANGIPEFDQAIQEIHQLQAEFKTAHRNFQRAHDANYTREPGAQEVTVTRIEEMQNDPAQAASQKDPYTGERVGWQQPITAAEKEINPEFMPLFRASQLLNDAEKQQKELTRQMNDFYNAEIARNIYSQHLMTPEQSERYLAARDQYAEMQRRVNEVARQKLALQQEVNELKVDLAPGNSDLGSISSAMGEKLRDLYLAKQGKRRSYYGAVDDLHPHDPALRAEAVAELERDVAALREQYKKYYEWEVIRKGVKNPEGIGHTPFSNTEAGIHLVGGAALLEAAFNDTDYLAISTAMQRHLHPEVKLSLKAAEITYDQKGVGSIERIIKQLGFSVPKKEKIVINNYEFWAWKLSPELKKKIREVGVSMMSLAAMTAAANDAAGKDGTGDKPEEGFALSAPLLAVGAISVTKGKGTGGGAFEYFAHNMKRGALKALSAANVTRHVAADAVKRGGQYLRVPKKAVYDLTTDALGIVSKIVRNSGHATWDDVDAAVKAAGYVAVKPEGGPPRLIGMQGNPDAPLPTKITRAQERAKAEGGFKLYSNPVGPAFAELRRKATPATLATLGYAASQEQDNRNVSRMAPPLFALAALNAIGTKRLGQAFDKTGDTVLEALVRSERGKNFVAYMNPDALLSPDIKAAVRAYEELVSRGRAIAAEYGGAARRLGPAKDRQISDVIEKEDWEGMGQANTMDVVLLAQAIKNEFDILARRKVASGVLEPGRVLPDYLPRRYAEWDALDVYAENGGGRTGGATRISKQHRRTLDVPLREAEDALREAHLTGDVAKIDAAQQAYDEAVYNQLDTRLKLGEIREASYRTAYGLEKGYADVAAAELFKTLSVQPDAIHPQFKQHLDDFLAAKRAYQQATNPTARQAAETAMDDAQKEMALISRKFAVRGGDWVAMPDSKGLGVLRGMVVKREIAHTINGMPEQRALDKLIRFWKISKTVFNPGTHIANILSNTTVAHMAGLNMIEQPKYLTRAIADIRAYGPATKSLTERGILGVNTVTATGEGVSPTRFKSDAGLRELVKTTRPETASVLRERSGGSVDRPDTFTEKFAKKTDPIRRFYNREDDVFRVALYLKRLDMGDTPEAAVKAAREEFGDFRTRSPALRTLRGGLAPFILYPAKVLPRFAKNMVDHPGRYLTLIAGWAALDQIGAHGIPGVFEGAGEVDEEDIEYRDRRLLGYFFPGFTQLPLTNEQGDKGGVGIERYTPLTAITDVAQPGTPTAALSDRFPRVLTPSGPFTDLYAKFANNYDTYLQEPRYKAYYGARTNIGRALEDAAQFALPSIAGFHGEALYRDYKNRDFDKMKNDLLGPTGMRPRYAARGRAQDNADYQLDKDLQDIQRDMNRALDRSHSPERDEEIMREAEEREDRAYRLFEQRAYTRKEP